MKPYAQITPHERYALSLLRRQGYTQAAIARVLCRHPSTIGRALRRNVWREDGRTYRPRKAQSYTNQRRRVSRRNSQFSAADWALVESVLREDFSPAQVVGWFTRFRILTISHETIYRYIGEDKKRGGTLHGHLRRANKRVRKRYGAYDSRGRLAGKRHISTRPAGAANRSRDGHWEVDTVLGNSQSGACLVTLVERKCGFTVIGKLPRRARRRNSTGAWSSCSRGSRASCGRSPPTTARSSTATRRSSNACRRGSTSRRRTTPGSVGRTRTRTD